MTQTRTLAGRSHALATMLIILLLTVAVELSDDAVLWCKMLYTPTRFHNRCTQHCCCSHAENKNKLSHNHKHIHDATHTHSLTCTNMLSGTHTHRTTVELIKR